jgi:O-antigen ligase
MLSFGYWLVWLFIFSIPCENIIVVDRIGTIGKLVGVMAFIAGIITVITYGKIRKALVEHRILYCWFYWSLLTCLWSIDINQSLLRCFTYGQLILMIWLLWQMTQGKEKVDGLLCAYIAGSYVSIGFTIYNYAANNQVVWQRYSADGFDPNELGLMLSLGIPISLYLAYSTKRLICIFLFRLFFVSAWVAIILTASRAAFVCAVIASLYAFIYLIKISFRSKIIITLFFLSTMPFIFQWLPETSMNRLATIEGEVRSGTLNNRMTIWKEGVYVAIDNILIGTGAGTFSIAVEKSLKHSAVAHNLYLTILVEQGIIGFVLFSLYVTMVTKTILQMPKVEKYFWLITIVVWAVGVFTLTWDGRKATWFILAMPLMHRAVLEKYGNTIEIKKRYL